MYRSIKSFVFPRLWPDFKSKFWVIVEDRVGSGVGAAFDLNLGSKLESELGRPRLLFKRLHTRFSWPIHRRSEIWAILEQCDLNFCWIFKTRTWNTKKFHLDVSILKTQLATGFFVKINAIFLIPIHPDLGWFFKDKNRNIQPHLHKFTATVHLYDVVTFNPQTAYSSIHFDYQYYMMYI